ncbi:MAG: GAF domain-containing protein, partial [Myxococcota bacterium]
MTERLSNLKRLTQIAISLSTEKSHERLLETILLEAKDIARADGGTIYLRTEDDHLQFAIMRTDSLGIALGGTTGKEINLPRIPMFDGSGSPNHHNVATHAALEGVTFNIPDAYHADGFDFSGTKKFDTHNGYRSKSFLTIPMKTKKGSCIGVLQLLNSKDADSGEVVPFAAPVAELVESLASLAAVALENQMLIEAQKTLLDSFIRLIADAIDRKSPYTGGHCKRVPVITEMLAKEACKTADGPLAEFDLTDEDWEALHIAAWLHDCG